MEFYKKKRLWKRWLLLGGLAIGGASLLYTHRLVQELAHEERQKAELWAEALRRLTSEEDPGSEDISFMVKIITRNKTVPAILTDSGRNIKAWINLDSVKSKNPAFLKQELESMSQVNEPIQVPLGNGNYDLIFYNHSHLLVRLKYYPYVQLGLILVFLLIAYAAFSSSRRAEQNRVWVGLARETAHQLGTPISSLLAWLEHLREDPGTPRHLIEHMQSDLARLERITERFSKIGSRPVLEDHDLNGIIRSIADYMQKRTAKSVKIQVMVNESQTKVRCNPILLEWVFENLIRNALNVMPQGGSISLRTGSGSRVIWAEVQDSGPGIPRAQHKTIFEPGFTTRKRGWGLGLSLSRRIVEEYHGGHIFVQKSGPGQGTTFRIELPKDPV